MKRTLSTAALAACALVVLLLGSGCGLRDDGAAHAGGRLAAPPRTVPPSPTSHIVVIVMENKEDKDVLGTRQAPYLTALAHRYGVATNSYGIRHPSLPNYLALTSGSTQGITSDCTACHAHGRSIADQLDDRHLSWKAYLEGLPRPCFKGASADGGNYRKKHNPFIYYDAVAGSPARCRKLVPFTQLGTDLRAGRLPVFSLITPNMCDDTHDCGVKAGDAFLRSTVPSVLRGLGPHGFLIITYDEGSSDATCCGAARGGRIATVVAGPDVRRGVRYAIPVDHYGVLGTIEDALGVRPLAGAARPASGRLTAMFTRPPRVR